MHEDRLRRMESENAAIDRAHKQKMDCMAIAHSSKMKELAHQWDCKEKGLEERSRSVQLQAQELQKQIVGLQHSSAELRAGHEESMQALEHKIHEEEYNQYQKTCKHITDRIQNTQNYLKQTGGNYSAS